MRTAIFTSFMAAPLAVFTAAVAMAQTTTAGPGGAGEAEESVVICKTQPQTGSRFMATTCMTRKEWDQMRFEKQRELQEMIQTPDMGSGKG